MIKYATALLPQAAAFCPQLLISLLSSLPLLICWRPRHEPPLQLEAACHEVSLPRPSPCSVRVHSGLASEIVSIMFSSPVFDLVLVLEDPHSSRSCFRLQSLHQLVSASQSLFLVSANAWSSFLTATSSGSSFSSRHARASSASEVQL